MHAKFHCFLNDQFHFVTLWQSLKQHYLIAKFLIRFPDLTDSGIYRIISKCGNLTIVLFVILSVNDTDFVAYRHAEYIFYMIHISTGNSDAICSHSRFFHKKSMHIILSFWRLQIPIRPDVSLPALPVRQPLLQLQHFLPYHQ